MKRWLSIILGLLAATTALAQPPAPTGETEQAVDPVVERRSITVPRIPARSLEAGAYVGVLNLDNFGSNPVYGARLGFHATEDFVLEVNLARSEADDDNYRRFGLPILDDDDVRYVQLFLLYNALRGEVFAGSRYAYRTGLYLGAGLGQVTLDDDERFSAALGLGLRVLASDWLTLRLDTRAYLFTTDILGNNEMTYNLELTAGIGVYF